MSENLYKAPESDIVNTEEISINLASRLSRLGASILDSIIMMIIFVPLMFLIVGLDGFTNESQSGLLFMVGFGLLSAVIFFLINFKFLKDSGQTIGKKALGIKIVDMNGVQAKMGEHLIKRYLAFFVPNQIPVIGGVYGFVNAVFIFRKDKRCIHDLIGGTQVVYTDK